MALSNLRFLNNGDSPNIGVTGYLNPPTATGGNLESEVGLSIGGYASNNNHLIVFSVLDSPNTGSSLSLKSDNSSVNLVDSLDNDRNSTRSWYSIDMGLDTVNGGDWSLQFNITLKDTTTPSFIFAKGKSTERPRDIDKTREPFNP